MLEHKAQLDHEQNAHQNEEGLNERVLEELPIIDLGKPHVVVQFLTHHSSIQHHEANHQLLS